MQNTTPTSLSVGETVVLRRGRPWMAAVLIGGVLLALVALIVSLVLVARPHDARSARSAATKAFTALVAAEAGHPRACAGLPHVVDGTAATVRRECRSVVGDDPGARVRDLEAGPVHIAAERGVVHVSASVTDRRGTRAFTADLDVTEVGGTWRLVWDGTPLLR